jgi:autotransporter translocation and assembly factor TamB
MVVLRGLYYKDIETNLLQGIGTTTREAKPEATSLTQPYLRNMNFDVGLSARELFMVENNMAEMSIRPDLQLRGSLNNPVLSGRATVTEGTVVYQRKEFKITRGIIDFVNPYKTEPVVDIEAEVKIRDWTITLQLLGPADKPEVRLSSVPSEEDADILSLLLFEKTRAELEGDRSLSALSPDQMISALVTTRLADDIKERTGLDVLDVKMGGPGGVKVTVGKQLTKRLTTKYSVEPGGTDNTVIQRASAEYKVFENMRLNGFQDTEGTYGGEVTFTIKFR